MHAIVLAGGTRKDAWAREHGVSNKALLPIAGVPMITYVVRALRETKRVGRIILVGPVDLLAEPLAGLDVDFLPEEGDMLDNVLAALAELPDDQKVLICTSDIPMVTAQAIENLLLAVDAKDADLYYPIINRLDCEQRYPGVKRTYLKLKEGAFTGGNIMIVLPKKVIPLTPTFRKLVNERKSPLKMLLTFGLPGVVFVLLLALGSLSVAELERRLSQILKLRGAAVFCDYPEIGTDVDKDSDLELARRIMAASDE